MDALLELINSLTRTEKRYFKLYSARNSDGNKHHLFTDVFDVVDKMQSTDLNLLMKKLPGLSRKQISDSKRHMYKQVLNSLVMFNANKPEFEISHEINKSKILYNKGLYQETLALLARTKKKAYAEQDFLAVYEIVDLEKKIESTHITRSHSSRAKELEEETNEVRGVIRREADWSELALNLYAKFLEIGHVKNEQEHQDITAYFNENRPSLNPNGYSYFFESLYAFQSNEWYHFITQNFKMAYKYSVQWIDLFNQFPSFKKTHAHLHAKGYHNCLSMLFLSMDLKRHERYFKELTALSTGQNSSDTNTQINTFIYITSARLNDIILKGDFSESKPYLLDLEQELLHNEDRISDYRLMVFWYRMASIYFTMGEHRSCIKLLARVIHPNQKKLREDLQCFARLLSLIAHFELENDELLVYQTKSTFRFLINMNESTKMHASIMNFLKVALFKKRGELSSHFLLLKNELDVIAEDPYERRSFLYLDVLSWLESKIDNVPVEQVIKQKRKALKSNL